MKLPLPMLLLAIAAVALVATWLVRRRAARREQALGRLLDAADALETRLRSARAELEAVTGDDAATRDALQEMLRQRLWLQQHGGSATLLQLEQVRESLDQARVRIDRQLQRIQHARATLA